MFRRTLSLTPDTRVLDLGGGNGAYLHSCLQGTPVRPESVTVADLREKVFQARAYGYQVVRLKEGPLPFADQAFDVVFCSSVIEHVVPDATRTDAAWTHEALASQRAFADEIRRVAKSYWVQTPARSFPIEVHSWLPFVGWLPRRGLVAVLQRTRRFWVSKHAPDFRLLTRGNMEAFFPEARIVAERSAALAKSWIAVKAN